VKNYCARDWRIEEERSGFAEIESMTNGKSSKRYTIYDVAEAAGVSYQTVSRVINNSPNVSGETRSRVIDAIETLQYRPNKSAQVLNTQRSHLLEVIAMDISTGAPAIDTMSYVAKQRGYKVMISAIDPEDLEPVLNDALGRSIDGIIFICSVERIPSSQFQALCQKIPFVRMIAEFGTDVPSVALDQQHGSRLATQHLIELGHRHIAEIRGPRQNVDSLARHEGWLAALKEAGLQTGPSAPGRFTVDGGYSAVESLLDSGEPFTAIVSANDEMAVGAIRALSDRGLRVPDDISIVGFDDVHYAAYITPPLTTIRQDFRLMARCTIDYLIELIEKPETPLQQHIIVPQLVIRQSTRSIVK
jgi:LacI family transcriptional regulator